MPETGSMLMRVGSTQFDWNRRVVYEMANEMAGNEQNK